MQVRRFSPDMKSKPEGHPGMFGVPIHDFLAL